MVKLSLVCGALKRCPMYVNIGVNDTDFFIIKQCEAK